MESFSLTTYSFYFTTVEVSLFLTLTEICYSTALMIFPIVMCVFSHMTRQFSYTSWAPYSSTRFSHDLPGESMRPHGSGARSTGLPPPPSGANLKSSLSSVFLTTWL